MPYTDAKNTIVDMSLGIPGAIVVLSQVWKDAGEETFSAVVAGLRALNYKGSLIWLAYKDWAGQDLPRFIEGVRTRDEGMQEVVREAEGR